MSPAGEFGKVEAPVDFRHRQTKRNLPPRAFSAKVQQMPLSWQTPGGNTLPPRHVDLHLRIATDGKDRCVSRQARRAGHEALSVGLSFVCASPLGSSAQITAPCASAVSGGLRRCKYSQLLRLLLRQLFQFSALQPIPIRSAHLASSIRAEDPLGIGHWALGIGVYI